MLLVLPFYDKKDVILQPPTLIKLAKILNFLRISFYVSHLLFVNGTVYPVMFVSDMMN